LFGLANPRREQVDNIDKSEVADAGENTEQYASEHHNNC
jgi:hypothetical protein